jgi:TP901 family phage tail tape measure protein
MGQQTLQTVITLSGKVDNTFGNIGTALINVGNHIDALSQKIINFGKESVEEFVEYDDVMREVQALGEYDDKTMRALNEYNKTIAQTSKYTMEQAAQAEVMMAQLGLNLDQTKVLMPTVMNLATAANIDLADSLDYLYYTLNALGMPMEYANTLSDQMSKTAAISAADINTLGLSMQRLGSGAQFFAGGSSEILAILGGISQFGQDMQGTNAGTQLRNFMLTLLAPTQSKDALIQSLRVTEEEWAEFESYMEDAGIDVNNTADAMNELGLSVYDSATGQLKPAIQIIGELEAALSSLPEGDRNEMLGKLFGKRTTTTALNLIAALDTIIGYQHQIEGGSAGYTESMAETMEGGLGGALREFTAAWDAFQTTIGETISPAVEGVADFMTDIVNGLTNMDKDALEALVSAAGAVAAAGPALLLAGGAFRLIGFAMTPIGAAALGLTALAAAAAALYQLGEANFAANFGDMELDTEALLAHVNGIGDAFNETYTDVNNYNTALETALTNFTTASTTLSSDLLTNMITGATLTPEQIASITSLGETMGNELLAGISASFDKSASYLTMLFGGLDSAATDDEYAGAILLADTMYENLVGQAEQLGREFGETLGTAMDDGIITGNEYNVIMEKMQAYNDAMAFAAKADQEAELAKQLHKAQSVSWDSAESFLAEQAEIMNANLAAAEETHIGERAKWGVYFDEAIRQGWINQITGTAYTDADKAAFLADMDAQYAAKVQGYKDDNAQVTMAVFDALMSQSGYGEAWQFLSGLYANGDLKRDEYGEVSPDAVNWSALFPDGMPLFGEDNPLDDQLYDLWRGEHGISGAGNKLTEILGPYMDSESIALIHKMLDDALQIGDYLYSHNATTAREMLDENPAWYVSEFFDTLGLGIEGLPDVDIGAKWAEIGTSAQGEVGNLTTALKNVYDFEKVLADMGGSFAEASNPFRDQAAAWQLMYGDINAEDYLITATVEPVVPPGAVEAAAGEQVIPATVEPDATIDAAGMEAEAAAAGAAAETSLMAGYGDPTLDATVDSTGISSDATTAGSSAVAALYAAWGSPTLTARVSYSGIRSGSSLIGGSKFSLFAEGGRATEASIFGEAGPEWAIPEEHTDRVASLFNAAREAAGFTWPELIARNGGLNAGGGTPAQIIYSPTIYANDANGVEQKLIEDKERLDRWWSEKQMHDDVEVYA